MKDKCGLELSMPGTVTVPAHWPGGGGITRGYLESCLSQPDVTLAMPMRSNGSVLFYYYSDPRPTPDGPTRLEIGVRYERAGAWVSAALCEIGFGLPEQRQYLHRWNRHAAGSSTPLELQELDATIVDTTIPHKREYRAPYDIFAEPPRFEPIGPATSARLGTLIGQVAVPNHVVEDAAAAYSIETAAVRRQIRNILTPNGGMLKQPNYWYPNNEDDHALNYKGPPRWTTIEQLQTHLREGGTVNWIFSRVDGNYEWLLVTVQLPTVSSEAYVIVRIPAMHYQDTLFHELQDRRAMDVVWPNNRKWRLHMAKHPHMGRWLQLGLYRQLFEHPAHIVNDPHDSRFWLYADQQTQRTIFPHEHSARSFFASVRYVANRSGRYMALVKTSFMMDLSYRVRLDKTEGGERWDLEP